MIHVLLEALLRTVPLEFATELASLSWTVTNSFSWHVLGAHNETAHFTDTLLGHLETTAFCYHMVALQP
jgi:hypothetical protein